MKSGLIVRGNGTAPHTNGNGKTDRAVASPPAKNWRDLPYRQWPEEEKRKAAAYQSAWRLRKRQEAASVQLPYIFKFCPMCATEMPTVDHKGKTLFRPCLFCPDCGYQMPIQPKVKSKGLILRPGSSAR